LAFVVKGTTWGHLCTREKTIAASKSSLKLLHLRSREVPYYKTFIALKSIFVTA